MYKQKSNYSFSLSVFYTVVYSLKCNHNSLVNVNQIFNKFLCIVLLFFSNIDLLSVLSLNY